jgi:hypothetical protein
MTAAKSGASAQAGAPVSNCPTAAMAPRSAPMFTVLATSSNAQQNHSSQRG